MSLCVIDDDGVGGGVVDQKDGWNFQPVNGASTARKPEDYPNVRSEVWFVTGRTRRYEGTWTYPGCRRIASNVLRRQAMAPTWKVDAQGRRVVEPKADTKKRIGRSPDDMDALNLAFPCQ